MNKKMKNGDKKTSNKEILIHPLYEQKILNTNITIAYAFVI